MNTFGDRQQDNNRLKKSVSSSVMPVVKQSVASKGARSCSRRRSKTPSPVKAHKDVLFKSKRKRGDTYTKADIERMLQSKELEDEFKENRRCTVAAPGQITRHLSNTSKFSSSNTGQSQQNTRASNETFGAEEATFTAEESKCEEIAVATEMWSPTFSQNAKLQLLSSDSVDTVAINQPSLNLTRSTVFGTSHFKSQSVANAVAKYKRGTMLKMNSSNN